MAKLKIIAEIHPQHGGDMGLIREMIRQASICGADVIKVQLYEAEKLLGSDWNYLELTFSDCERIKSWCEESSLEFSASVFSPSRVKWCADLNLRSIKIASRTLKEDPKLCESILNLGIETIISLGMWDNKDSLPYAPCNQIRYLHCVSKYPSYHSDMVGFPQTFSFDSIAGYSDHTLGIAYPLIAISRGAKIIEKHMTLDKTIQRKTERAHVCSMTPKELRVLRVLGDELFTIANFNEKR